MGLGLALLTAGCGESALPSVVVKVTPTTIYIPTGYSYQFAATVTGTSNIYVTWDVNGVVLGNSKYGFITSKGFYKAPASIPSGGVVTVTATSQELDTKSSSATVHIVSTTAGANTLTVSSGQAVSNVDVEVTTLTPSLVVYGAGGCSGSSCATEASGVEVAQGGSATIYLVGAGLVSGTVYSVSGTSSDVTVVQPSDSQFGTTSDGTPSVSFDVTVSSTATAGPRNIVVTNPTTGEMSAFVGGLLITSGS